MELIKAEDFDNLTEETIINRILTGEKPLYQLLLKRNNLKLYRIIRSYLKKHEDVQDAMQNTYLKAYENLHKFKKNSSFSTWLIRIGINEALTKLKAKNKHVSLKEGGNEDIDKQVIQLFNHQRNNPENNIIIEEVKLLLEKAIDQLDSKHKAVYILREVEEMSISKIADCLKLSESNVKVRLHRAKLKMRENLYDLVPKSELFNFGAENCDKIVAKVYSNIQYG
ncbi:RNA polymerase sigma factor [Aureibaculum sp. 2210JD6-5]|uniref:RNA polymerase sigma factor n=1 Tax=Aureibaculum sp. 2210JD6-5 TaxID=3103957 RepID=UPI002AAD2600|nr:RNA polymerase sigma factor [Aureibaculum sp. 2210JD6-5]MDY7394824.1 RNA polymerase sigma factor [Aureibaculum sp. 2210JD6-5]